MATLFSCLLIRNKIKQKHTDIKKKCEEMRKEKNVALQSPKKHMTWKS